MQRYQLELILRHAEGALARVIGVAERRGFTPVGVDGQANCDDDRWHLRLAVESDRPAELLLSQLRKLYDCMAVEVSPCR